MICLYLDTSSQFLSLALVKDKKVLKHIHRPLNRKHSARLVTLINSLLKKTGLTLRDIDTICVGKGPGSFTGLRIGITTIKGLAFALGIPVVAIPSLDFLAQNITKLKRKNKEKKILQICTIVDAKQNKVYSCIYKAKNGVITRDSEYLLIPLEELLKKLSGEIIFLGDGISLYREKIQKNERIRPVFTDEALWYPDVTRAIDLLQRHLRKRNFASLSRLNPLYLYPQECQIKHR